MYRLIPLLLVILDVSDGGDVSIGVSEGVSTPPTIDIGVTSWRALASMVISGDDSEGLTKAFNIQPHLISLINDNDPASGETLVTLTLRTWLSRVEAVAGTDVAADTRGPRLTLSSLLAAGADPALECPALEAIVAMNARALRMLVAQNASRALATCWSGMSAGRGGNVLHALAASSAAGLARVLMRARHAYNRTRATRYIKRELGLDISGIQWVPPAATLKKGTIEFLAKSGEDPIRDIVFGALALLPRGAAREALTLRDSAGRNPINIACTHGRSDVALRLLVAAVEAEEVDTTRSVRSRFKAAARATLAPLGGARTCIAAAAAGGYAEVISAIAAATTATGAENDVTFLSEIFGSEATCTNNGPLTTSLSNIGICGRKLSIACPHRTKKESKKGNFSLEFFSQEGWHVLSESDLSSLGLPRDTLTNSGGTAWTGSPLKWTCAVPTLPASVLEGGGLSAFYAPDGTSERPFVIRGALPRTWLQPVQSGGGGVPTRALVRTWLGTLTVEWGSRPYELSYGGRGSKGSIASFLDAEMPDAQRGSILQWLKGGGATHPPRVVFDASALRSHAFGRRFSPPDLSAILRVLNMSSDGLGLTQLALGPAGSGSPPHFHGRAANGCVVGVKLWLLWPPSSATFADAHVLTWFGEMMAGGGGVNPGPPPSRI